VCYILPTQREETELKNNRLNMADHPKQRRQRREGERDEDGDTVVEDAAAHIPASLSSSLHVSRLPPLPDSSNSNNPNNNNSRDDGPADNDAMPFLLHRGEDGSVPADDEIVAALSANIEILATAMRREGEMTETHEAEIVEMRQMLSVTKEMLAASTTTSSGGGEADVESGGGGGGGGAGSSSNAIAAADRPPPTMSTSSMTVSSSFSSSGAGGTGGTGGGAPGTSLTASTLQEAPGISMEAKAAEMASLSDQERTVLFEDLYGRKPEHVEKMERLLRDVSDELVRMPPEEKTDLLRARDEFPSLCRSSRHTLIFLQVEDFDPKKAAKRMVSYWTARVHLYGDRAFTCATYSQPTDEDNLVEFHKSVAVLGDPNKSQKIKGMASAFLATFCDQKLKDMDEEISALDPDAAAFYFACKEAHPDVINTNHRLGFLQASDYNASEAAKGIVKHWFFYNGLFGNRDDEGFFVYKPVTLSGSLSDDCQELLFQGDAIRVMHDDDDHGRGVVYLNVWSIVRSGLANGDIARVIFYAANMISDIESARYKGFVVVSDHTAAFGASEEEKEQVYQFYNLLLPMRNGFPLKLRAVHRLNPPPIDLYEKLDHVLGFELRGRTTHTNGETQEENLATLSEYGIGRSSLPDIVGGDATKEEWTQWLDEAMVEGH